MLSFEITRIGFPSLEWFGDIRFLADLAEKGEEGLGFPLLDMNGRPRCSVSPFLERGLVREALVEMNPGDEAPTSASNYVVAGQQVGLMTGPFYTILKAISAITLCQQLSERVGEEVRPLFWCATEDHDVLEVNRFTIAGRRFVHAYRGDLRRGCMPQVADIPLIDAREPVLDFLHEVLPPTEFTPWVMGIVARIDFSTYATAFSDLLHALFGRYGLLLVDPIALRPLTSSVLAHIVERWADVENAMATGAGLLKKHGFDPPLKAVSLFEIVDGNRVPVAIGPQGVTLSMGRCSLRDAAEEIRKNPSRYSPGAALRPVCQDAVLPALATIGGPAELVYLWQIMPLYEALGFAPSARYPRITATFLSSRAAKNAQKAGLTRERIFDAQELILRPPPQDTNHRIMALEHAGHELLREIDGLDFPENPRWLRTSRKSIETGFTRIINRVQEVERERHGLGEKRLRKVCDAVLPDGKFQERVVNVLEFLNLYGPEFIERCIDSLDPTAMAHQVVVLQSKTGEVMGKQHE